MRPWPWVSFPGRGRSAHRTGRSPGRHGRACGDMAGAVAPTAAGCCPAATLRSWWTGRHHGDVAPRPRLLRRGTTAQPRAFADVGPEDVEALERAVLDDVEVLERSLRRAALDDPLAATAVARWAWRVTKT